MSAMLYRMPSGARAAVGAPSAGPSFGAIVVGGGTAGAVAAIVLAESGVKTLVIERLNCLGGTGTAGNIEGYYYGNRGGLYEQLDAQAKAFEPHGYTISGPNGYHPLLKRRVLEQRLRDAGAEVALEADITGAVMDGNRVAGVEYAWNGGLYTAYADIIIDATAEGYVCLLAGAEYTLGRDSDAKPQPYSCVRAVLCENPTRVGHAYSDTGYGDPTDPEQYAKAVLSAAHYANYLLNDYRAGQRLLSMSQLVGMREGPLVIGDMRLTLADIVDGINPRDNLLFTAYSNADNHGKDMAFENSPQQDWMIAASLWGLNFTVNVPVGAVIPRGIDGLLMAGRLISVDHDLASCIRMERDVQKCGEAVGVLAAEAALRGLKVRDVPYAAIEQKLRRSGCLLDANDFGFIDSRVPNNQGRVIFPRTFDEIINGLKGAQPGMAMWSVRTMENREQLYPHLKSNDENLRKHTAMALALSGDAAGADILMECAWKRDSYLPGTSRKYNMIRGAAAVYLLGRLAYAPALPTVLDIVSGWETIEPAGFVPDEFLGDEEEYRFQFLTQAIVTALKIAKAHPGLAGQTRDAIHQVIDRDDFSARSTLKGGNLIKFEMAPLIRNAVARMEEKQAEQA